MSDMNQTLCCLHLADPSTSEGMKKSACFARFNTQTPKSACFHKSPHARSARIEWCHWKESRKKKRANINKTTNHELHPGLHSDGKAPVEEMSRPSVSPLVILGQPSLTASYVNAIEMVTLLLRIKGPTFCKINFPNVIE